MRTLFVFSLLLLAGMAGCLSSDDDDDSSTGAGANGRGAVPDTAPAAIATDLLADVEAFATTHDVRRANAPTHESARVALADMLEGYGLEVYRHDFVDESASPLEQVNIVGIKWGEVRDHWVVVGGHYDTFHDDCIVTGRLIGAGVPVPDCPLEMISQGAYDNVAGTMMTMHIAKAFADTNTRYTMAFVAFDGEERGTQGARAFVNDFVTGNAEENFPTPYGEIKVVGAVNLDMIGLNWPGVNAPIEVISNSEDLWTETRAKGDELGFPEGQMIKATGLQLGSSDYARFWEVPEDLGGPIPTVFYISDFEALGAPAPAPEQVHTSPPLGVYPFWHLADRYETMELMAGGPILGPANLEAGFQAASDIASHILWRFATDSAWTPDAVVF